MKTIYVSIMYCNICIYVHIYIYILIYYFTVFCEDHKIVMLRNASRKMLIAPPWMSIKLSEKLGRKKRKTHGKTPGFHKSTRLKLRYFFRVCYESDGPSTDTVPVLIKDGYFPWLRPFTTASDGKSACHCCPPETLGWQAAETFSLAQCIPIHSDPFIHSDMV